MALQVWLPLDGATLQNKGVLPATITSSSVTYAAGGKLCSQCKNAGTVNITGDFNSSIESSPLCSIA